MWTHNRERFVVVVGSEKYIHMQKFVGGDTIRQLQVQSGAHIELHRGNHPNPAEKLFNIRGK